MSSGRRYDKITKIFFLIKYHFGSKTIILSDMVEVGHPYHFGDISEEWT